MERTMIADPGLGTKSLSDLISIIALQYFSSAYSICILTKGTDDPVNDVEVHFDQPYIKIDLENVTESIHMETLELGCQVYVLYECAALDFLDIYRYIQDHTNQRFSNKAFIVLMGFDADLSRLQVILNYPIVCDIPKLLIVRPSDEQGNIELWTNKFSGQGDHQKLVQLDAYIVKNRTFLYGTDLFPDKIKNLEGRYVRLAIINYEPYTTWTEVDDESQANAYVGDDKNLLIDGTETRVLLEFCRIHNCTFNVATQEADQWGEVYENFSGVGITGAIADHRVDVGIGAMLAWFYDSNSPSHPLSRTGVTCITPKQKLLPSWLTPILPFSYLTWIVLLVTAFVTSIVLIMLNHLTVNVILNSNDKVDVCEVFSSVASSLILCSILRINQYKLVSQLTIITILLFSGLIIGNTYCGGLSSIMTVPQYEIPIDTPAQLATTDMIWGASHDAWVYALKDSDEPLIIKLLSKFRTMTKSSLHEHAKRADMAYTIERLQYGHYGISEYIALDVAENFQVMMEDVYWGHCVAQVTKTWPMMEHLNELILHISQSGVQRYWEEQVLAQFPEAYTIQKIIGLAKIHDNPGAVALKVYHLAGPFYLLLFGLTGAVLAFLLELALFGVFMKMKKQPS